MKGNNATVLIGPLLQVNGSESSLSPFTTKDHICVHKKASVQGCGGRIESWLWTTDGYGKSENLLEA